MNQSLHACKFCFGRWPVFVADLVYSQGRCANIGRNIWRDTFGFQEFQVATECCPLDVVLDVALLLDFFCPHRFVERTHRVSFTHHFERDALPDVAQATTVFDERLGRPGQHVDEAGRHCQPFSIDLDPARGMRKITNDRNPIVRDRQITDDGITAQSVIEGAATNDDVVIGIPGIRRTRKQYE